MTKYRTLAIWLFGALLLGGALWVTMHSRGERPVDARGFFFHPGPAPVSGYAVVAAYPHDRQAFTQGLIYQDGYLYESTGLRGQSSLRQVELESGKVLRSVALPSTEFGEGLTVWRDRLIQLTWTSLRGYIYDKATLQRIGDFTYSTEGWGITSDGRHLIISDGSATLYFWDPETFRPVREVNVHDQARPIRRLNELEFVRGEVWANIWQSDFIVRISPADGHVIGYINLRGLLSPADVHPGLDVLNGIAYDPVHNKVYVTGKRWPKLFEIVVR